LIRSSSIEMTLPSGLGVFSVMAASFCLSWLRLSTSSSARFGAASPTQLCERLTTSSRDQDILGLLLQPGARLKPGASFGRVWPETWVTQQPVSLETTTTAFNCFYYGPGFAALPWDIVGLVALRSGVPPATRSRHGYNHGRLVGADYHFLDGVMRQRYAAKYRWNKPATDFSNFGH
jgi:hypothetical protein